MDVLGFFRGKREPAKPTKMQGQPGFVVTGGYVQANEINSTLVGTTRWKTASDLLTNLSIIAAGVRYTLNLIARPTWRFEPADDSAAAKEAAEFAQSVLDEIDGSWTSTVRRMALYRYHGFGLHEWQAKQRDDGKIGIEKIAVRPCHTIEKWDIDDSGEILGVIQKKPIDGKEQYLPRAKLIYLVDDSLTDSPEGMGWFRHLAEPANRLRQLLRIETMGFERDLNGIPVGRAPISKINSLVGTMLPSGQMFTQEMANAQIAAIENFVRMEAKKPGTGLLLDSQPHGTTGSEGETLTSQLEWDIDLLTSDPNGLDAIAKAINRIEFEMSLIMGTESMLVGKEGEGSRALSEDKSRNLYLLAESTLDDMCEFVDKDLIGPIWAMNGLPEETKPKAAHESVSAKDADKIARVLRDMATAGAVLAPDDPAINDVRDLLDVPHAPELTDDERAIMMGTKIPEPPIDPNKQPGDDEDEPDDGGGGQNPPKGQGQARKFDPNQPRDPGGEDGGQWVAEGQGSLDLKRKPKVVASERWDGESDNEDDKAETLKLAAEIDKKFVAESSISEAEQASLTDYQVSGYKGLNEALRNDSAVTADGVDYSDTIEDLDRAIAKERTAAELTVYRGLHGKATEAENLPEGSVLSDKAFSSTSANPRIGAKFASWAEEVGDEPVLMRIKVPKGASALHLHPGRALQAAEHEVLLPRGARFKIVGKPKRETFDVYSDRREVTVVDLELVE